MKKLISIFVLISLVFGLFSCGEYTSPLTPPSEPCPPHRDDDKSGICDKCGAIVRLPDTPSGGGESFSATVTYNGAPFITSADEPIFVQWTDGYSYYSDAADGGVATVTGLDGDYRVTLKNVPEGYTYDPNAIVATNDNRNVEIKLYKLTKLRGLTSSSGSSEYKCINITGTGFYSVEIKRASQAVFYEFHPNGPGVYTIESWVDITENTVNPKIDIYYGNIAAKYFDYTLDDGGPSSTYTKNFVHTVNVDDSNISGAGGGGVSFTFAVKLTEITGKYPEKINFVVKRDGEFDVSSAEYEMVIPTERFVTTPEYDKNVYKYVEAYTTEGGVSIYDGTRFGYNDERGCYCLYNEQTGLFDGPILYAKISQPTKYVDRALAYIEQDNNCLRVSATEDYSLFIKGWSAIVSEWDIWLESLSDDEFAYYAGSIYTDGYGTHCNSDGVYKVTEELKEFLQKFSISQLYFRDGDGWVERDGVYAAEDDQWLFACGYYVEK